MTDTLSHIALPVSRGHMRSGRARAAMSGSLWSLVNMLVATIISAVVFLLASRFLTPDDFGVVALAATIMILVSCVIPIAFGDALVQRAELRDDHLDTVFWTCAGFGAFLYLALCLLTPWIAAWTETPALNALLPVIGVRLILESLNVVPTALVTRNVQFRFIALRTTMANLLGGAVCIAMVLMGSGYWALAVSQVLSSVVSVVVMLPAARWRPGFAVTRKAVGDLWNFGIFSAGNRLLLEMRLDQLLIGVLGGPAMLGLFFFARRLFQMVSDLTVGVFSPVTNVLLASMQSEPEKRRQAFMIASYAATAVALPTFTAFLVLAPSAVPFIFGAQWTEAVDAVQGFAIIGMIAGLGVVQASLIRSQGRAAWWFWYQALVQLSALPIIAVLYQYGLGVVMVALAFRTILFWPLSIRETLRILDMGIGRYFGNLQGPISASFGMASIMFSLPSMLPADLSTSWLLAAQAGIGTLVYLVIGWATSKQQATELWNMLRQDKGQSR
jgi:teichuronic acid exporter